MNERLETQSIGAYYLPTRTFHVQKIHEALKSYLISLETLIHLKYLPAFPRVYINNTFLKTLASAR